MFISKLVVYIHKQKRAKFRIKQWQEKFYYSYFFYWVIIKYIISINSNFLCPLCGFLGLKFIQKGMLLSPS